MTEQTDLRELREKIERADQMVQLLDANGDSVEDPLRVPRDQADWFLDEWLKVPDEWREWRSDNRPRRGE